MAKSILLQNQMKSGTDFDLDQLSYELQDITKAVRSLAQSCQEDSLALLAVLRQLEELHREIREELFQSSLPNTRQALHSVLKDIEARGGWPYIERMRLQSLLVNLLAEATNEESSKEAQGPAGSDQ